ncbi:hypothetical protein Lesp02_12290 [Lentzea sp. NBRC 105346]|uniref:ABC transporter permease n=1 Tax=Lentzea sp. NBRC 105346 TaxID=3032205 RepID=UPI0024A32277|nr:ABC transporter permease [Lentzea sp. NBRC 105346]GLZ29039.1 hypothetical protein Lesp02_12290 [Lentzea sp. NBRC 105346]
MHWIRVFAASTVNAAADFAATYTWRTWTFAWLSRIIAQVLFFTLIGTLLGSPDKQRFLLIGATVMAIVAEVLFTCASSTWERRAGTLPLLVASPGDLLAVFAGRSIQWVPSSVATSSVCLLVVGPFFGVHWTWGTALALVPVLVVTAVTTYCFALVAGAFVLNAMDIRNIVANVLGALMTAFCGAVVPVSYWPGWVGQVVTLLPTTHGLRAVRALADGGNPVGGCVAALLTGVLWLVVARLVLHRLAEHGRRDGTIEFGDS